MTVDHHGCPRGIYVHDNLYHEPLQAEKASGDPWKRNWIRKCQKYIMNVDHTGMDALLKRQMHYSWQPYEDCYVRASVKDRCSNMIFLPAHIFFLDRTSKTVLIRDRWLGLAYSAVMAIIILYIIVWRIGFEKVSIYAHAIMQCFFGDTCSSINACIHICKRTCVPRLRPCIDASKSCAQRAPDTLIKSHHIYIPACMHGLD